MVLEAILRRTRVILGAAVSGEREHAQCGANPIAQARGELDSIHYR
jgi:hypothetical protein